MDHEFTHPSYVTVSFSRASGNPRLFGSTLQEHYSYVTLRVSKATMIRSVSSDRIMSSLSGDILEIDLSNAQFAELLTTMNVGVGTPGTLRRFQMLGVDPPPEIPSEVAHIQAEADADFRKAAADVLGQDLPRARAILSKPALTKADRVEILRMFERVERKLTDHVPFILEMLNEAVGKRVSAAKAEIDAVLASTLHRLGMKSLAKTVGTGRRLIDGTTYDEDDGPEPRTPWGGPA
jgi:hypothetical protein